jgi:hypothetical protein
VAPDEVAAVVAGECVRVCDLGDLGCVWGCLT